MRFAGKVALVAAASKGIGRAIASGLAAEGARVAICARSPELVAAAADEMNALGVPGDIGDAGFLRDFVARTEAHFGATIDIVVANNGGPPPGRCDEVDEEQWTGALQRNLMSAVRLVKLTAPGMRAKRWGRFLVIASTTAKEPDDGMVLSNTTRAAAVAFAKTVSRELGPDGITVNTILTGAVLTDRLRQLIAPPDAAEVDLANAISAAAEAFPVRYIPSPSEFSRIALFLLSDEARYLTGLALPVDGGFTRSAL